ncbi:type II secretion system protein [Candidatus Omnitrophota bacterium]
MNLFIHSIRKKQSRFQRGFTLIEVVMVVVLIGILAGIGGPLTLQLIDSFQYSLDRRDLSEAGNVALSRMGREIRRLKSDTSVLVADPATYQFVDIDGNTIEFSLKGNNLARDVNGAADILATDVSSLQFTYLDDQGAVIATPIVGSLVTTDIKFIEIALTLQADDNTIEYLEKIRLRNVIHLSDLFP